VYWVAEGDGTVAHVNLAGGAKDVLYSPAAAPARDDTTRTIAPHRIALDAANVYWVEPGVDEWRVRRTPKDGGAASILVRIPYADGADSALSAITLDPGFAYVGLVARAGDVTTGELGRVPLTGGGLQVLVPMPSQGVTVDGDGAYFTTIGTSTTSQALCSVAKTGGTPTNLGSLAPQEFQLDGDDLVYFAGDAAQGTQFLVRQNKFGATSTRARTFTNAPVVLANGPFTADARNVYVAVEGAVYRVFQ
jgi:hypothetical protein